MTSLSQVPRRRSILNASVDVRNFLKIEVFVLAICSMLEGTGLLPPVGNYVISLLNIALTLFALKRIVKTLNVFPLYTIGLLCFMTFCLWSSVSKQVDLRYAFWSSLSLSRPLMFGLLILAYWEESDFMEFCDLLLKSQWFNGICVLVQLAMGNIQDLIGGMFGSWIGCNVPLNIYLCLVSVISINAYLAHVKHATSKRLMFTFMACLVIAAVAEIKFFFVEFVVLVVLSLITHRPTMRTAYILAASIVVLLVAGAVFNAIMPDRFRILLSFDSMYGEGNIRGAGYGTSRVEVYSQLSETVFANDPRLQLLGMGFGSFSSSSMSSFVSPLYMYFQGLRVDLLESAILFCETGYLGTILYFAVPVLGVISGNLRLGRQHRPDGRFVCGVAVCGLVLFAMNFYYNASASSSYSIMWSVMLFSSMGVSGASQGKQATYTGWLEDR